MITRKLSIKAKKPMTLNELSALPEIPRTGDLHPRNAAVSVKAVKIVETGKDKFSVEIQYA